MTLALQSFNCKYEINQDNSKVDWWPKKSFAKLNVDFQIQFELYLNQTKQDNPVHLQKKQCSHFQSYL